MKGDVMAQELTTLGYSLMDDTTQKMLQACLVLENNPFKKGNRLEGRELVVSSLKEVYSLILATDKQDGSFIYVYKYLGTRP